MAPSKLVQVIKLVQALNKLVQAHTKIVEARTKIVEARTKLVQARTILVLNRVRRARATGDFTTLPRMHRASPDRSEPHSVVLRTSWDRSNRLGRARRRLKKNAVWTTLSRTVHVATCT